MSNWITKLFSSREAKAIAPTVENPSCDTAEARKNLGNAHLARGELDSAVACYRQAIAIDPCYAEAYNNLGVVFLEQGRDDDALALFQRSLVLKPGLARAYINCGNVFRLHGLRDEAIAAFDAALAIDPVVAEAHNNLGVLLQSKGEIDKAGACFQTALSLDPDFAEAHHNLGDLLLEKHQLDDAIACFQKATQLKPTFAEAHNSSGIVWMHRGRIDLAQTCFETALALKADFAAAYSNLGALALGHLGEPAKAVACLQQAIALDPTDSNARFNLSMALLSRGLLADGWAQYRYRFDVARESAARRAFPAPEWAGEPLADKTILLWTDQGIGDEMLFASLLPDVIARAQRCIVECTPKLLPLFARSFPDALVVPRTDPPHRATRDVDYQIATGDAARWLRASLKSFPHHHGYLTANPERVAWWKARLAQLGDGLKVGFCWRSSLVGGSRHLHYTGLEQWGPIFAVPGVHFINLQYDTCATELTDARQQFAIPLHAFDEVDLFNDIDEAAALTKALDIVITAPTAVGSIAAGQGVPTLEMGYGATWVSLGTDHVPWLPALHLYMRRWDQPWAEIIAVVARQLQSRQIG